MVLFGAESEDAQKALVKVQAAMAFAQGVQGIMDLRNAMSVMVASGIAGMKSLAASITATGVGAIIVGIGVAIAALVVALDRQSAAQRKAAREADKLAASLKNLAEMADYNTSLIETATQSEINSMELAGEKRSKIIAKQLEGNEKLKKSNEEYAKDFLDKSAKAIAALDSEKLGEEEYSKRVKEIQDERDKQLEKTDETRKALFKSSMQLRHEEKMAEKQEQEEAIDRANAAAEKNAEILKAKNENEKNANLELNEEKRKLREIGITDEATLSKIQLENELARLKEARDAALQQENLTAAAKKAINDKFDISEQIAKTNHQNTLTKIQKDAEQKRIDDLKEFEEQKKQITQQEITETQANIDRVFKIRETDIYNRITNQTELNEALQKLETERLERQLREMKEYGTASAEQQIALENQIAKRKADIYKADADAKKQANDAKMAAEIQFVQASAQAIGQLGQLFKEGSDAAKVAALTEIAVNTAIGFIQGLDIAQKGAKATGPAAPLAFPIFYASQIAAVLGAAGRAKQILKGGGVGSGGGIGNISTPSAPNTTPLTGGILPDMEQPGGFAGMGRVYVLEGDITKTQTRVRRVRNVSVV